MTIYTSYFAKFKTLVGAEILPISISRGRPRFIPGRLVEYKDLAPTGAMLKMSNEDYLPRFVDILNSLDPEKVLDDLKLLAAENEARSIALCCYEKPSDFCHRHMVSEWLNKHLPKSEGQAIIVEFGVPDPKKLMGLQRSFWKGNEV